MCPPRIKRQTGFYKCSTRTAADNWVGGPIRLVKDHDISLLAPPYLAGELSQPPTVKGQARARYMKARTDLNKLFSGTISTKPQAQSPFLRLPEEIRCQIIEYVLGNRLLHIKLCGSRRGKKIWEPSCLTSKYGEDHVAESRWINCSTRADRPTQRSLSLLMCCKAVYVQDYTNRSVQYT